MFKRDEYEISEKEKTILRSISREIIFKTFNGGFNLLIGACFEIKVSNSFIHKTQRILELK